MPYKLIALDIDGTILDKGGKLRESVKNALKKAMDAGIHVTLATGRRLRAALPLARELGIRLPLVLNNGALVVDPVSGETLFYRTIPVTTARMLIRFADKHGCGPVLYRHVHEGPDVYYSRVDGDYAQFLARIPDQAVRVPDLVEACDFEPVKIVLAAEREAIRNLAEDVRLNLKRRYRVIMEDDDSVFAGKTLLEFFHHSCSKGSAVRRVARMVGVPRSAVVAIGDNLNDLEMIRYAGLGVAMGNGPDAVKSAARAVTATNDEDGVVLALERYVFQSRLALP